MAFAVDSFIRLCGGCDYFTTRNKIMDALQQIFNPGTWTFLLPGAAAVAATLIISYCGTRILRRKNANLIEEENRDILVLRKNNIDLNRQSIILPGPERARACVLSENGEFTVTVDPSVTTLYENFLRGMRVSKNGQCIGYRPSADSDFRWFTYGQILEQAHAFGAGLKNLGLSLGNESTFVGIYSQNRPEWFIANFACMSYSTTVVPLYDTLGVSAVQFIIHQAEMELVVCDSFAKAEKLLQPSDARTRLKHIVFTRNVDTRPPETLKKLARDAGVQLREFDDIIRSGEAKPQRLILPKPDDLYMICYTSGTTGNPKGVMLTHKNLLADAAGGIRVLDEYGVKLYPGEAVISYLPLAHMFEQIVATLMYYYGGKIGIFRGDINRLLEDIKVLKPACFPVVPRLLNRLYDKIQAALAGSRVKKAIFQMAINAKIREMKTGVIRKNTIWDKLLFNRIQNELGGRVRFMVTGSAPIRDEVLTFTRAVLSCLVMEAYGQTECTACATNTFPGDFTAGHVGGPLPCCHVKLVDVPELEYYAKNDEGEICVRGPTVTRGYFHDPERTKEILDEDGWLHTGDVGRWLPNGTLKIIDRKKHIFKLAQGEYVAPEKIENVYGRSPLVAQVYVDGSSLQRFLVAVVIPDEKLLKRWAAGNGKGDLDFSSICADSSARKYVLSEINTVGKRLGLNSIELVKAVHLSDEPFTIENGLLTPTMKLKRPQLRKHFADIVEKLYAETQDEVR